MKNCSAFHKTLPTVAVAVAGLALATAANGQTLYTNGGLSTGATAGNGASAPAGTTWSEVQADAGNTTESNTVAGFADSDVTGAGTPPGGFRIADNFVVPAGQTWDVSAICVFSYKTGAPATPSPFDAGRLQVWNGRPGDSGATVIFGDLTTNRMTASTDALMFRVFNTTTPPPGTAPGTTRRIWRCDLSTLSGVTTGAPLTLAAGTYWVEWQISDTANGTHFAPPVTIVGDRGLPGWNGRQFTAAGWADLIDAGNPATAPDVPQDMPFIVKGAQGNPCNAALPSCRADVDPAGTGNGVVDINDLLAVIGTWGQNNPTGPRPQGDCDPLPNGNCLVDINDLLTVIGGWGNCPIPTGACCFANGSCTDNLSAVDCGNAGGNYQGDNSTCAGLPPPGCPILPANDNCANAAPIGDGVTIVSNQNATLSTEPGPTCTFGGVGNFNRDVWFTYTATCTGHLTIDTCATTGGVNDTVMALYTGTCASLTEVACGEDAAGCGSNDLLSTMTFDVTSGTTYIFRLGTWGTAVTNQGPIAVNIVCAPFDNDFCGDAVALSLPATTGGTLSTATPDSGATCNGVSPGTGRWYTVTNTTGGPRTFSATTCSSPLEFWDARISVYCGSSCDNLFCVAGVNADSCNFVHETVNWCAANNQTYWILVHAPVAPTAPDGNYILNVTNVAACAGPLPCGLVNDEPCGALTVNNGNNAVSTVGATTSAGVPNATCLGTDFTRDAWYKYTPTATGFVEIKTCTSTPQNDGCIQAVTTTAGNCPPVMELGCDDDGCGTVAGFSIMPSVAVTSGQPIFIRLGSWRNTSTWSGTLVITASTPPPTPDCSAACNVNETEACGADQNGGCNATPNVYQDVLNNNTICGTTHMTTALRDTDWYRITVGPSGRVEAHLQGVGVPAGVNIDVFIVNISNCAAPALFGTTGQSVNNSCALAFATGLTPGTQVVVFAGINTAGGFVNWPCPNNYKVTVKSP